MTNSSWQPNLQQNIALRVGSAALPDLDEAQQDRFRWHSPIRISFGERRSGSGSLWAESLGKARNRKR